MKIVNKTKAIVAFGNTLLVPAKPIEIANFDEVVAKYPLVAELVRSGDIEKVSEEKAAEMTEELEKQTVAGLREYAKNRGINIEGLSKKADIVNAIMNAAPQG